MRRSWPAAAAATLLLPVLLSCSDSGPPPIAGMIFVSQPASTAAGAPFSTPVRVALQDAGGATLGITGVEVYLAIDGGTVGGHLLGQVTTLTRDGVATFDSVYVDSAGTGYRLLATTHGGMQSAMSTSFDVSPGAPAGFDFITQPAVTQAGARFLVPISARVLDRMGNRTTDTAKAVVSVLGPSGGVLAGTTAVSMQSGVVAFPDISVTGPVGTYKLQVSASEGASTSLPFALTPAAYAQYTITSLGWPADSLTFTGFNNRGEAVGFVSRTDGTRRAFFLSATAPFRLLDMPASGGTSAWATGINDSTTVIGNVDSEGVLWPGAQGPPVSLAGTTRMAIDLNDSGAVLLNSYDYGHVLIWRNGRIDTLHTPNYPVSGSRINDRGDVAYEYDDPGYEAFAPAEVSPSGAVSDFREVGCFSADGDPHTHLRVLGISDSLQVLVYWLSRGPSCLFSPGARPITLPFLVGSMNHRGDVIGVDPVVYMGGAVLDLFRLVATDPAAASWHFLSGVRINDNRQILAIAQSSRGRSLVLLTPTNP